MVQLQAESPTLVPYSQQSNIKAYTREKEFLPAIRSSAPRYKSNIAQLNSLGSCLSSS